MMMVRLCCVCGNKYSVRAAPSVLKNTKFCSNSCKGKARKGIKNPALSLFLKGKIGANSRRWVGDKATYAALHRHIRKIYGNPAFCDKCGTPNKKVGKRNCSYVQWASKAGVYSRNREDWLRLCVKCHYRHDIEQHPYIGGRWAKVDSPLAPRKIAV